MSLVLGVLFAGLMGAQSPDPSRPNVHPPIFQPGAPGAAARTLTVDESVALSRSGFVDADVAFMQRMLVHHAQAVEMVALMPERPSDQTVRRLGQRIAASQAAEMELMADWLTARGLPLTAADPHAGHAGHQGHGEMALMPGMLTPAQMQALASATGTDFDRLFLTGMIQHHQGALDMVDDLNDDPDAAEDPLLSGFAASVVADQSAEILRMQSLLSQTAIQTPIQTPASEARP